MTKTEKLKSEVYKKQRKDSCIPKEKTNIILAVLSVITAHSNSCLLALPLVFLLCCKEKQSRNIIAVALVIYFGASSVTDIFCIPYMAFVFTYSVAEYFAEKHRNLPLFLASAVFALIKGYVLSYGFSAVYYSIFIAEVISFVFVPQAVISGEKHLRENALILNACQFAECAVALAAVALAISGVKLRWVDLSLCFLMSLCFFYSVKDNMPLGLLSVIMAVFTRWQDSHFAFIFVGFLAVGFASFVLLGYGCWGCFGILAVSLGITLGFLANFNSFLFLTTTAVALAVCFVLSGHSRTAVKKDDCEMVGEKDYLTLAANIDRLGRAFRFLGATVTDISNLVLKEEAPKEMHTMVAEAVCRKCKNNHICWQQNFDHTQQQFSAFETALWKGGEFTFDKLFLSVCGKAEQLTESFYSVHRLLSARRLIGQAGRHQQQVLQNQFFAMAQSLQDIVYISSRSGIANTAYTHTVNSLLLSMGRKVNYCLCFQNPDRCVISTTDYLTPRETEKIKVKLESIYNERFSLPYGEADSEGVLYSFIKQPRYKTEIICKSKGRYNVCGDICEEFSTGEYSYAILADGMGTGSFAAAESRTAVEMLKSLLMAGITAATAIDIANIALNLKGTGQSCAALDILQINLYSGKGRLYKAGGAQSVVMERGKSRRIYSDSLPIGILKDTKTAENSFELSGGDMVIMMSDGVEMDKILMDKISLMAYSCPPEQLAEAIISDQSNMDDATAVAVKLVTV